MHHTIFAFHVIFAQKKRVRQHLFPSQQTFNGRRLPGTLISLRSPILHHGIALKLLIVRGMNDWMFHPAVRFGSRGIQSELKHQSHRHDISPENV